MGAINAGAPVTIVYPDQDGLGTLVIPNTVALIAGAPHPAEAQAFVNFLLSDEAASLLLKSGWTQIPERAEQAKDTGIVIPVIRRFPLEDFNAILTGLDTARTDLREIFVK